MKHRLSSYIKQLVANGRKVNKSVLSVLEQTQLPGFNITPDFQNDLDSIGSMIIDKREMERNTLFKFYEKSNDPDAALHEYNPIQEDSELGLAPALEELECTAS
jgi:hypothetical protein